MAQYSLIDTYLSMLRHRVLWRVDLDDLVAEVRDHLYSTAEGLEVRGHSAESAQRETLERFGAPELIARAFATTPRGGLAVPTRSTTKAGTLGIAAGLLWFATVGFWWLAGVANPWGGVDYDSVNQASGVFYMIGAAALLSACAMTLVAFGALDQRHGGFGMLGRVGLVVGGIGVVGALAAWVFMGWGLMMLIATVLVGREVLAHDIAPRSTSWLLTGGVAFGVGTWVVLRFADQTLFQWGGLWGDFWIPNLIGVTVVAVLLGTGLIGLGSWLRRENPVDFADQDLTATA